MSDIKILRNYSHLHARTKPDYPYTRNVWGWLLDWWIEPAHTFIVPCDNCANLTAATYRGIHGGSYGSQPTELLAGYSSCNTPSKYFTDIGVRCARDHL
jgi:formylglycine-generating enzyme required for sulfatase activity